METQKQKERLAVRVTLVTMVINAVLSAFKLAAGILASSGAMVSDAVHSLSDLVSDAIVIAGVRLGGRGADQGHPYGHERLESLASLTLGVILGATGLAIAVSGLRTMVSGRELQAPGALALAAAAISIVTKEGCYWYTIAAAKKLGSTAMKANAWHHRSDALSSVGSFLGIFFARLGAPILDPLTSVIISVFIGKVAFDVLKTALSQLLDCAMDPGTVAALSRTAAQVPGVVRVDRLLTRQFGDRAYVDMDIALDGGLTLRQAHAIAKTCHDAIEAEFPRIKHCMVHMNPAQPAPEEDQPEETEEKGETTDEKTGTFGGGGD